MRIRIRLRFETAIEAERDGFCQRLGVGNGATDHRVRHYRGGGDRNRAAGPLEATGLYRVVFRNAQTNFELVAAQRVDAVTLVSGVIKAAQVTRIAGVIQYHAAVEILEIRLQSDVLVH